ncbi:MAG: diguanylate cyclase [Deltaproteobacteria bacterium]|nr:diguanylate cyclase [Deltaproteobacteria bacterium]
MATILVVDDTASLRAQICEILRNAALDLEVLEAGDGIEALPRALGGGVDVVLSDVVMPNLDGIALLRAIRQQRSLEALPVILVTSETESDIRTKSFEAGASDYLTRPFSPAELVTRVQVQLRLKALQTELQRTSEGLSRASLTDALTGLANRHAFLAECHRELARSRRHTLPLSICVLDVDRLRDLNGRVGHRAADAVITELGELVRRQLRTADTLARFSGGRFALLLPHADAAEGRRAGQRVCDAVAAHGFLDGKAGAVTIAVGSAAYPWGQVESVEELLNLAEKNLDCAKSSGGNQVYAIAGTDLGAEPT